MAACSDPLGPEQTPGALKGAGRPKRVVVVGAGMSGLVAAYELSRYYHHGRGEESYLRSLGGDTSESGRNVLDEFHRAKREILEFAEERAQGGTFGWSFHALAFTARPPVRRR